MSAARYTIGPRRQALASPTLQMLTLSSHAGIGVSIKDGEVFMAFDTDGDLVDITMTKDQAEELGSKLLEAAVSSGKCNWSGQ